VLKKGDLARFPIYHFVEKGKPLREEIRVGRIIQVFRSSLGVSYMVQDEFTREYHEAVSSLVQGASLLDLIAYAADDR
jgi:hypothetical protein